MARGDFSAIPEPQLSLASHQEALIALKETVEVLARQRRTDQVASSAVTFNDLVALGLIQRDEIPKR
jgi:hypothetical protein